jgi:ankyrin repeat protein
MDVVGTRKRTFPAWQCGTDEFIGGSVSKKGFVQLAQTVLVAAVLLLSGCSSREEQLFDACINGDTRRIDRLISKGVDVNARSPLGEPALLCLIALNAHRSDPNFAIDLASTVEKMINAGADVKAKNDIGVTALHLAAGIGHQHRRLVELLIAAGADPNAVNTLDRSTPLHAAAFPAPLVDKQHQRWGPEEWAEHHEVLRLLLDAGADVDFRNLRGRSPLDTAQEAGSQEIFQILSKRSKK